MYRKSLENGSKSCIGNGYYLGFYIILPFTLGAVMGSLIGQLRDKGGVKWRIDLESHRLRSNVAIVAMKRPMSSPISNQSGVLYKKKWINNHIRARV